jgi:hypothetical protein
VRQALGLTTIGSFDVDKRGREQLRATNKKNNSADWRRRKGAVPRVEYLAANNASRDEPWVPLRISKATYYRRLKKAHERETSPNTPNRGRSLLYTDQSQGAEHIERDGAYGLTVVESDTLAPVTGGSALAAPPPLTDRISPFAVGSVT